MSSFWNTSSGTTATGEVNESSGSSHLEKGDYNGSLDKAENRVWEGKKSISLQLRTDKNRVTFLNLKCWDEDEAKRDRALNLLVKIFQCAKVALPNGEPTDADLAKLCNKPMRWKLDVWETDDKSKSGNWLVNVASAGATVAASKPAAPAPKPSAPTPADEYEEEIPF